LTDDRFETLVKGVREGRRIFSNLQHAVIYIAAIHVPTAGVTLLAAVAGLPPLLLPIHIACLELLIDPACTLVFEAEKPPADLMRRPPRRSRLFDAPLVITGLTQGLIVLVVVLGIVGLGVSLDVSEEQLRSLAFSSIVLSNTGLLLANRSRRRGLLETLAMPNPALWIIGAAGALLAYLATAVPPLARIFHMAPLPLWAWVALVVGAVVTTLVLQSVHALAREREGSAPA
jgi:Ca2+-transporting ATPase